MMREEDANTDYTQLTKTCPMFYDADRSSTVTGSTETWRGHDQMSWWRVFVNLRFIMAQATGKHGSALETKGGDQIKG